ncbi:MAG TPA: autotransporter domain-containing protein [Usitatibacter sp.]|nr:autotransporter domain-containing protein [Usitatibacter sp.]
MKTNKRVLPALVFSLFAAFGAGEAQSAQFSNVIVFGDSLSDAGYYRGFLRSLGLPQSVVDGMGRFTTNPGPIWAELVAQYYGVTPNPSNVSGGTIYAQGGARITATPGVSTPPGQAERPIATQIGEYLTASGGTADPNALYAVWGGANDVFFNLGAFQAGAITQAQLQANVLGAAAAEIQQIARLRAAGARYIMVFALPDIGATPAFASAGAATAGAVSALSAGYNTTLFTGLASAGIRVIPVDAFSLFAEVRANPASFGISNISGIACGAFPPITTAATVTSLFCNPGNTVPGGANSHAFADGVHPTSAAHRIVSQLALSMIEGPSQYGLLAEGALRSRQAHIRAIGDGVTTARHGEVGRWAVFAGVDRSEFDIEPGTGLAGLDSRSRAGTFGITGRASEAVTVGLAYGTARNTGTFGMNGGGYTANEKVWSLFASAKWGGLYGTGVVSIADLEFNDIHRHVAMGNSIRRAGANGEGSNSSAQLTLGYDFPLGRFTVGPTVSVTTQNVEVNAFDESGAGVANLRIHQQKRRSEVWSGGVRASFNAGAWTPWLRVTADKERRDDERLVSATALSMVAIGASYDVPTYSPDTTFWTAALGVNGWITDRVGLSVSAFTVRGRSGIDESGVNAMVGIRF